LHSNAIIDQTFETRKYLALAISRQFFGCLINQQTYSDWWLINGISNYLASLYYKKAFGNNEYKHQIYCDLKEICSYEKENGYICLDFKTEGKEMNFSSIASMSASFNTASNAGSSTGSTKFHYSIRHPLMLSSSLKRIANKKSFLVIRTIEDAIGNDVLLQVLNKLLAAATQASNQKYEQWSSNFVVSTESFLKLVSSISSKDLKPIIDQWVCRGGFIRFNVSSTYNRKRNCLEFEVKQDNLVQTKSAFSRYKYIGPLTVIVQELDGSFSHTIQLEENVTRYDIVLHSKGKRSKKKKIPLSNGEEIDIDLTQINDTDSPILWFRIDPEMKLIREIEIKQEGYQWQMELKYERDICAQLDAITQLKRFQAKDTRDLLTSIVENHELYYQVRIQAANLLAELSNGQLTLLQTFKKFFMYSNSQKLVKQNNFNDLQQYFLQKNLPIAMGKLRNMHNMCPNDVITFLIDLVHYNENGKNLFSDCYYKAALIDALNETISSTAVAATNLDYVKSLNSNSDLRAVVEEIVLRLNLEKLSPVYHFVVTSSCLRALRNLQKLGHLPENINLFKQYAQYGTFEDVRKVAFEIIIKFFEGLLFNFVFCILFLL
jgi:transcription initiation factor TFIID subunit 2